MTTDPKRMAADTDKPHPEQQEPKNYAKGKRYYESLTNQEFITIHKSLVGIQKQLSHPEFSFVGYLLKMTIQEFTMPRKSGDTLKK